MESIDSYLINQSLDSSILIIPEVEGSITDDINEFDKVQILYIHNNDLIGSLPILYMPLTSITLSYTSIDNIDDFLSQVPYTLKSITVNNCLLSTVNISRRLNIESLRLQDNQLTHISNLDNCPNLKTLNLSHNKLSDTINLAKLSKLSFVDVSWNNLSDIIGLDNNQFLIYMNASHNKLIYPPIMHQVSYLFLAHNLLLTLDDIPTPILADIHHNPIGDNNVSYSLSVADVSECPRSEMIINNPYTQQVYTKGSRITIERFDPLMAYST